MRTSLLSTGEEILRGEVLDSNAAWAAETLDLRGFPLWRHLTCGDDLEEIRSPMAAGLEQAEALIVCGGLGPTVDDRTAEALAGLLGVELQESPEARRTLEARFAHMGVELNPNQLRQARLPQGAQSLPNAKGTAPGIAAMTAEGKPIFCLPGPPHEYQAMLSEQVLPRLEAVRRAEGASCGQAYRVLKVFGMGEGAVAEALGDLEAEVPGLLLGFRAALPEIHVKLRMECPQQAQANTGLQRATELVRQRLGDRIFSEDGRSLAEVVVAELRAQDHNLALAESCTGGLVAKTLTDVPGASAVFLLSAVTYANEAKQKILGVPESLLAKHGAVSAQCAEAMAEGLRRISGADLALSITGIAGPDGGSPEKPVGTVFFGICDAKGCRSHHRLFPLRERFMVRAIASHMALELIRRSLRP